MPVGFKPCGYTAGWSKGKTLGFEPRDSRFESWPRSHSTQRRLANFHKFLERERVVRVATIGRNGVPHVVPVCHVVENGKIYFSTDRDSKKAKNLGVHPRAAVVADLYSEDWPRLAGAVITGPATLIDQGSRFRKLRKLLYQKYPQYAGKSSLEAGEVVMVQSLPVDWSPGGWTKLAHILVTFTGQDSFSVLRNTT